MYTINNEIDKEIKEDFNASKLFDIDAKEVLLINLKKNAIFPKHTSPGNARLIMLEGTILFYINDKAYSLKKNQIFNFPKDEEHWVEAHENSKFLIIR